MGLGVVAVVGDHQRDAKLIVQIEQTGVDRLIVRIAMVLQLEEVVLAEDLAIPTGRLAGPLEIRLQDGARRLAAVARAQRDEPAGVLGQQRAVDPRLVVVALQAGTRHQLEQVAVAFDILG